jgi:hypothetical protein
VADFVQEPNEPVDGELLLRLDNARSIRAADLGELFAALAKDYRQISGGRELIVYRLVEGSLWAIFRDAAGLATGANSIITFGKTIVDMLNSLRGDRQQLSSGKPTAGLRTIETLLKTATQSGSRVELRYRNSRFRGEEASFTIEPPEAPRLRAKILEVKRLQRSKKSARFEGGNVEVTSHLGSELVRLARSGSDIHLLNTIATVLVSKGAGYLVEEIATQLESEGHLEAARVLRSATRDISGPTHRPLLR